MAELIPSGKALTVNPLKTSQPMGAALAFFGVARCLPLEHGAQGCTAFSKVFFTRHFREPIPLQTTAMDHLVTVLGADASVIEGLFNIAERDHPEVVGLITTGLTETQGADIQRTLHEFRATHPQHAAMSVVPVNAPDTEGCLESGYALAVEALIDTLVPETGRVGQNPRQVNVLAGSLMTPGDIETVSEWMGAFGLQPLFLPDLGDSLDGHLNQLGYTTLTTGGISYERIVGLGESVATLVIGESLHKAADRLKARTGVPDHRFPGLMGLQACDAFTQTLAQLSGEAVPPRIERQRARLLDAMVDGHLQFGGAHLAVAADPDLLAMLVRFAASLGVETVAAVSPLRRDWLAELPIERVTIGDLEDLEQGARDGDAHLLIANSHAVETARRLGVPLLRAGFPLYDQLGAFARGWMGYAGSRQALFDLANLTAERRAGIAPYRSLYWQGTPRAMENGATPTH